MAIGIVITGMTALGKSQRKIRMIATTVSTTSISVVDVLEIARRIRSERSYTGTTMTPFGMPGAISRRRALTPSMTSRAL